MNRERSTSTAPPNDPGHQYYMLGRHNMFINTLVALVVSFSLGAPMDGRGQEPSRVSGKEPEAAEGKAAPAASRPSLEEARRQSAVLHTAMHATLQAVHHRYYREDEGLQIPAATLKEVFADLEKEHQVTLRWLVVEGQAMNSDHKARSSFEKDAVAALKAGKNEFERSESGVYRRAGSITLTNLCLKCHVPDRKSTKDRTAGLIISIPIEEK